MMLSIAVIIILVLVDTISCQDCRDPFLDSTFFFGHLVELDKIHLPSKKMIPHVSANCLSGPKIFIQVSSSRGNGIESALGYALLEVPTLGDGTHEIELPTWKPIPKNFVSRQMSNLRDYYFGTQKGSFESMKNFFLKSGDRVKRRTYFTTRRRSILYPTVLS